MTAPGCWPAVTDRQVLLVWRGRPTPGALCVSLERLSSARSVVLLCLEAAPLAPFGGLYAQPGAPTTLCGLQTHWLPAWASPWEVQALAQQLEAEVVMAQPPPARSLPGVLLRIGGWARRRGLGRRLALGL